jgi:metal-responsive CopG/Arc/MetJ family transcriptional regulator
MVSRHSVGISIPENLLVKIDQDRGDVPRSRFLQRLVEQAYKQREMQA